MNKQLVKNEIQNIIDDLRSSAPKYYARHKQYDPSKTRIRKLEELGVLDCMPEDFGNSDAKAVIEAIENEQIYINFDAVDTFSTPLQEAMQEPEETNEIVADEETNEIKVDGEVVKVQIQINNGESVDIIIIDDEYEDADWTAFEHQMSDAERDIWEDGESFLINVPLATLRQAIVDQKSRREEIANWTEEMVTETEEELATKQ